MWIGLLSSPKCWMLSARRLGTKRCRRVYPPHDTPRSVLANRVEPSLHQFENKNTRQTADTRSKTRHNPLSSRCLSRYNATHGRLAQRLEHPVYTRKAEGSNPSPPTMRPKNQDPVSFRFTPSDS